MKALISLILYGVSLLCFVVLFCFIWLESVYCQLLGLAVILLLALGLNGIKKLLHELLFLSPFILLLISVYALFAGLSLGQGQAYWLHYAFTRTPLLLSTLIFMQLLISRIQFSDLLDLPLGIHKLKYIILGKLLFEEVSQSYAQFSAFTEFIPTQQCGKRSFTNIIRTKIMILLAMLVYTLNEASLKGEMVDNRIRNCYTGYRIKEQKKEL